MVLELIASFMQSLIPASVMSFDPTSAWHGKLESARQAVMINFFILGSPGHERRD
jgi:hypothetical protein